MCVLFHILSYLIHVFPIFCIIRENVSWLSGTVGGGDTQIQNPPEKVVDGDVYSTHAATEEDWIIFISPQLFTLVCCLIHNILWT